MGIEYFATMASQQRYQYTSYDDVVFNYVQSDFLLELLEYVYSGSSPVKVNMSNRFAYKCHYQEKYYLGNLKRKNLANRSNNPIIRELSELCIPGTVGYESYCDLYYLMFIYGIIDSYDYISNPINFNPFFSRFMSNGAVTQGRDVIPYALMVLACSKGVDLGYPVWDFIFNIKSIISTVKKLNKPEDTYYNYIISKVDILSPCFSGYDLKKYASEVCWFLYKLLETNQLGYEECFQIFDSVDIKDVKSCISSKKFIKEAEMDNVSIYVR